MVEELLSDDNFRNDVDDISLLPRGGGIFEITVNGRLVFSKKELDRFPEEGETPRLIREQILK